ncbi:MAG: F0F1 ATP synthase subunit B [Clostridium sp.]
MDFDINAYLRLNPMDMIMVCISTLIIVLVAKHFFWDKVQAYLDARESAIQADIDAGVKSRAEAETYKKQYEAQMASAKGEAHEILESAKANALLEKREILAAARDEADALKEKARKDIEREKVQARSEMKDAIVEVAFEAAKQIVNKELDETAHKQYVDDFIEHAGDESWQA